MCTTYAEAPRTNFIFKFSLIQIQPLLNGARVCIEGGWMGVCVLFCFILRSPLI